MQKKQNSHGGQGDGINRSAANPFARQNSNALRKVQINEGQNAITMIHQQNMRINQAHTPDTNKPRYGRMEASFISSKQHFRDGSDDAGSRQMNSGKKNTGGIHKEVKFNDGYQPDGVNSPDGDDIAQKIHNEQ